jgi:hypothetical protein
VVLEGVGAGQRRLATLLDAVVWVQTDLAEAEARGIARDLAIGGHGDLAATRAFWDGWMAAERPFLDRERPWERAALVVSGSSREGGDDSEIAFAPGPAYVGAD